MEQALKDFGRKAALETQIRMMGDRYFRWSSGRNAVTVIGSLFSCKTLL